jgi:hypothetical protein
MAWYNEITLPYLLQKPQKRRRPMEHRSNNITQQKTPRNPYTPLLLIASTLIISIFFLWVIEERALRALATLLLMCTIFCEGISWGAQVVAKKIPASYIQNVSLSTAYHLLGIVSMPIGACTMLSFQPITIHMLLIHSAMATTIGGLGYWYGWWYHQLETATPTPSNSFLITEKVPGDGG